MERTLHTLDQESAAINQKLTIPCDEQGTRSGG
jgi:hypothetical protein